MEGDFLRSVAQLRIANTNRHPGFSGALVNTNTWNAASPYRFRVHLGLDASVDLAKLRWTIHFHVFRHDFAACISTTAVAANPTRSCKNRHRAQYSARIRESGTTLFEKRK